MDMLHEPYVPSYDEKKDEYVYRLPLGDAGAMPLIVLHDLGQYARWIFDHPLEAKGLNLEIATCHATGADIASAFTATTGKAARYEAAELAEYLEKFFAYLPKGQHTLIGEAFAGSQDNTLISWGQNFHAWWEIYRSSGGNKGIVQRDYAFLDRILPNRVKSVEEWMRKVGYTGERRTVLKDVADRSGFKE